jgi:hypothetical protein
MSDTEKIEISKTSDANEKRVYKELPLVEMIDLGNSQKLKVYQGDKGEKWYDFRYYNNNYPTKKGIRLRRNQIDLIKKIFD